MWTHEIEFDDDEEYLEDFRDRQYNRFTSRCPPPVVLHCCQESRAEALKFFKLDFGFSFQVRTTEGVDWTLVSEPRIYINWLADTVCILETYGDRDGGVEDLFSICQKNSLRSMAFGLEFYRNDDDEPDSWYSSDDYWPTIRSLRPWTLGVEEFILFPSLDSCYYDSDDLTLGAMFEHGQPRRVFEFTESFGKFDCIEELVKEGVDFVGKLMEKEHKDRKVVQDLGEGASVVEEINMPNILACDIVLRPAPAKGPKVIESEASNTSGGSSVNFGWKRSDSHANPAIKRNFSVNL